MPLHIGILDGFRHSVQEIKKYGIYTLDAEGIITSWNLGAEEVQGYTAEEVVGKSFASLYGKQIHKPVNYFNDLLLKSQEIGYIEEEGWRQRKDETYFWSSLAISPIYAEGKLIAYSLVSKDLTAKKLASELPEITESIFKGPIYATTNITWVRSFRGEFLHPVLQWEEYTGQGWPEHQGFGWLNMHPEEDRDKILSFWRNLQELNLSAIHRNWSAIEDPEIIKHLTLETKLWSKAHDEYRHIITSVVPIFNADSSIKHWVGNEKDEHKIILAQAHTRELLEKQQMMLSSAKIGLWEYDIKSGRLDVDVNVAKFFGIDMSTFRNTLSEGFAKLIPEDAEKAMALLKQSLEDGKPNRMEFKVIWSDGSLHYIIGNCTPQFDRYGRVDKVLGCSWDVTATNDLMSARARIEHAEFQREEQKKFVDTICHELRNPLNGIVGHIDELEEVVSSLDRESLTREELLATKQQLKNSIRVMSECSKHQKEVINQVLDLSQIEKGKTILLKQNFSLQAVCRCLAAIHSPELKAKKLAVELLMPDKECWVRNDETRFRQIFINILSNAVHYTDEGKIVLKLDILEQTAETTKFTLSIIDSGPGFTQEQLKSLFERFSSATRHSFAKYRGTGLGLSISKELAELLGGEITVESTPGHGSTFRLSFTFETGAPIIIAPTVKSALVISPTKPEKIILVVDDNKTNRQILERQIRKSGFKCIHAEDGEQAISAFQEFKPDLIFMDIEMPKKDGFAAAASIRELEAGASKVPIFAVTGYAREEYTRRAEEVGMNGLIIKPFTAHEILEILSKALEISITTPKESPVVSPETF